MVIMLRGKRNTKIPQGPMKILYDEDIKGLLTYHGCIEVLEGLIRSKKDHNVIHPPRHIFPTQKGSLTFTIGELIQEKVAGFRLYGSPKTTQITVTMDTSSGEFKGLIIGKLIGVFRTACLNAVAIKYLSRVDSQRLGVIGSGFQARHHTLAAMEVRDIREIRVYSRSREKQINYIRFVQERVLKKNINFIIADSSESVVEQSDILICATNSPTPVIQMESIGKGLHINNIGPKYKHKHELPFAVYHKADILTTDSLSQLYDQSGPGFGAACFTETIPKDQILGLEKYMEGFSRESEAITLFCSMGLAGSEVAIANWLIESMKV